MHSSSKWICSALFLLQVSLCADEMLLDGYFDDILIQDLVQENEIEDVVGIETMPRIEDSPFKYPSFLKGEEALPELTVPKEEVEELIIEEFLVAEEIQQEPPPELKIEILPKLPNEDLASTPLPEKTLEAGHSINFNDVPMEEFVRFVSKISAVNFIFDRKDLDFNVSLTSGKAVSAENVLSGLLRILRMNGFWVKKEDDYFVIHKVDTKNPPANGWDAFLYEDDMPAVVKVPVLPEPDI